MLDKKDRQVRSIQLYKNNVRLDINLLTIVVIKTTRAKDKAFVELEKLNK
jgi:hypothetical protein